jgi:hypothetical protein
VVDGTPRPLTLGKEQGTDFTGGWVGPRDGLERWGACNITKISEHMVFGPKFKFGTSNTEDRTAQQSEVSMYVYSDNI